MLKVLRSINGPGREYRLSDQRLEAAFDRWWPALQEAVRKALQQPELESAAPAERQASTQSLSDTESKMLQLISLSETGYLEPGDLAALLTLSEQRAKFHLQELYDQGYLSNRLTVGRPIRYALEQKGRKALIDLGLL